MLNSRREQQGGRHTGNTVIWKTEASAQMNVHKDQKDNKTQVKQRRAERSDLEGKEQWQEAPVQIRHKRKKTFKIKQEAIKKEMTHK